MSSEARAPPPLPPDTPPVDVPMLSQDEFFRHLELQSVHSVKFTYRQALKERLRATTKKNSLDLPPNTPTKPSPSRRPSMTSSPSPRQSPSISPKWLSPQSCRRIFGRPKIKREKLEEKRLLLVSMDRCDAAAGPSSSSSSSSSSPSPFKVPRTSILGPLINNCHLYRHPKVSEEIERFSLEKKLKKERDENENCSGSGPRSNIIERIDFDKSTEMGPSRQKRREIRKTKMRQPSRVPIIQSPVATMPVPEVEDEFAPQEFKVHHNHYHHHHQQRVVELEKEYEARIRIQPKVKAEDLDNVSPLLRFLPKTSKPRPPPPSSLLAGTSRKISQIPTSSPLTSTSSSSSSFTISKNNLSRIKLLSKQQPLKSSNTSSPVAHIPAAVVSHKCRHCFRCFSSRGALAYHEENGHLTCRMCRKTFKSKWKKSKAMHICQECVRRFPNSKDDSSHPLPLLPLIGLMQKRAAVLNAKISWFKCDICPKRFPKQSHMIKHVLAAHASEMHQVNLEKFQSCLAANSPAAVNES